MLKRKSANSEIYDTTMKSDCLTVNHKQNLNIVPSTVCDIIPFINYNLFYLNLYLVVSYNK